MNVRVYMCVNIGFNECFDDTERIRAVYSLILKLNVRVYVCQYCIGYNELFKRRNDMQLWRRLGATE